MPILTIEIVARPQERFAPELALELADRAGDVFNSAPGHTWVTLRFISREHYAENLSSSNDIFPVFVSILKAALPAHEALQAEATRLTDVIARCCNRPPDQVHLIYLPDGIGRIAFGGKVVL